MMTDALGDFKAPDIPNEQLQHEQVQHEQVQYEQVQQEQMNANNLSSKPQEPTPPLTEKDLQDLSAYTFAEESAGLAMQSSETLEKKPSMPAEPPLAPVAKSAQPPTAPASQSMANAKREAQEATLSAQAARSTATVPQNSDLYQYAYELAKLDEVQRIETLTKDEIEAVAMFDKYFQDNFQKLVKEREKQEIQALGEPFEDYLDRVGMTHREFTQEIANKVYNEDRPKLKAQHEINVRKTIRLAEIQAKQIAEELKFKKAQEALKLQERQTLKSDYEAYIRGELLKEVMSKGIPIDAYKKAYEEIKSGINILSPKAKELTRIAVLNYLKQNPNPRPDALKKQQEPPKEPSKNTFYNDQRPLWL